MPLEKWETPWCSENVMSRPAPGQVLLYAGGPSESELLVPYGDCVFNSKYGTLSGNHFLTIVNNFESLTELGKRLLWGGARNCTIQMHL